MMPVFDLDTLQATTPIVLPSDYVQSVATSANAILVHVRRGSGADPGIDRIDMTSRVATPLPSLGVYQNSLASGHSAGFLQQRRAYPDRRR